MEKSTMKREELLKHAGQMVIVHYHDSSCFIIGWFFAMDLGNIHLKITSTKFETYESRSVALEDVNSIEQYEMN